MAELKQYNKYATELFSVRDTMGVPHPYCITAKHVGNASDNFSGMLGKDAIEDSEKKGISCGMQGCQLSFEEHETALSINCKSEDKALLEKYLLSIKKQTEKDGYAGFVLIDCFSK